MAFAYWVSIVFVAAGFLFYLMGRRWSSGISRPKIGKLPIVSVIIPCYNSSGTIGKCIGSAMEADYPKKEIIVVNDSDDDTPLICRKHGIRCIQNRKRVGKAKALNMALKHARGNIIFLLDADTVIGKDAIRKCVRWFADKRIAAVQPRYAPQNPGIIARLVAIEDYFNMAFFKSSMFLGTLMGFRGCSAAVRKSCIREVGGWKETIAEDLDMSAKLVRRGYIIQYEPEAEAKTMEPENLRALARQKARWGKAASFAFLAYRKLYLGSPQFYIYLFPYMMGLLAVAGFLLQPHLYVAADALIGLVVNIFIPLGLAGAGHVAILIYPEKRRMREMMLLAPYIVFYIPFITLFYVKGIAAGMLDKKRGKDELGLKDW